VFSWDEAKNRLNQRKHGVSFELAKLVFDDPLQVTRQDRTEAGERRWQTRGESMSKVPKSLRKELAALAAKPESEIDFSDIPATTERDWRGAQRGKFYRPVKRQLTVRIDADVIEWLKSQGRGYQSRLNEILRAAMVAKLRHR
jgi:uncharacterized protein (DUF4415 family)